MKLDYTLEQIVDPKAETITQVLKSATAEISRRVIHVQDEATRRALLDLGWTPPPIVFNPPNPVEAEKKNRREAMVKEVRAIHSASFAGTAFAWALVAHRGQFRRDGVTAYLSHVKDVVRRIGNGSEELIAVAWLHDVLEDSEATPEDLKSTGVPAGVIEAVVALTKPVKDSYSYTDYIRGVSQNFLAKRVKVADILSNLSDSPTNNQIRRYAKALTYLMHGEP